MDDATDTHEPYPYVDEPPAGEPIEQLPPIEQFRRLAEERTKQMEVRSRVRKYCAGLLAEHGVDGALDRLPPDIEISSDGVVRFLDAYQQDERWRDVVAAYHDELGDRILPLLPPDTTIDAITKAVTVDAEMDAWWI